MPEYIFLDTWTLGAARADEHRRRLRNFVIANRLTAILSSLSLVELYNPGWRGARGQDRSEIAAGFYASIPCVIVDPLDVWVAEIANSLDRLNTLPIRFNLTELHERVRAETLLRFLRRDPLFLAQGRDIEQWSTKYQAAKQSWLNDIDKILRDACATGNLRCDSHGHLIDLAAYKEQFLWSLDLRNAKPEDIERLLRHRMAQRPGARLTAVRLSSLLFWYLYVDVESSNLLRRHGSDLGDIYHLSLLPYCAAFTTDMTMRRMLERIREPLEPIACTVMTKPMLESALAASPTD